MQRVYNFAAGPATLPLSVLEKAQADLLCYGSTGMSVMEMSHRSKMYEQIISAAQADLRALMNIPDNYKVLFLQGGATLQFAMVPLNLMKTGRADYVDSGNFASNAIKEAKRYGQARVAASSKEENYRFIPPFTKADLDPRADYLHITTNNTIFGTRYTSVPKTGGIPLVADMSSNILSEPIDVSEFGLIYAGAQKNIGPAGLTVVIIREDLIGYAKDHVPAMLNYKTFADSDSMYNTPPTFAIYIAGLVFRHVLENGGLERMKEYNEKKAEILYRALDESKIFHPAADAAHRSLMNVTFTLPTKEMDADFVSAAGKAGFVNIKGHRLVGGMRASIYNAMPIQGVQALADFIRQYEEAQK